MNQEYFKEQHFFFFGFSIELGITFLWLRIFNSKGKDNETILSDLIKEIGPNNQMNNEQKLWFFYIMSKIRKDIVKEVENIMNKKINNLNEKDQEKIIKALVEENEKSNSFFIFALRKRKELFNETLNNLRKEINILAREIAENYTKERRKKEEEKEEERRRRRREVEKKEGKVIDMK